MNNLLSGILMSYLVSSYCLVVPYLFLASYVKTFIGKPFGVVKYIGLSLLAPFILPPLLWQHFRR